MGTSVNDLKRLLESILGFEYDGGDHARYVLKIDGKIIARTKFSRSWRGNQQIDNSILPLLARQLHCSVQMLRGLLRGGLGKKDYYEELLKGGFISQDIFASLFDSEE